MPAKKSNAERLQSFRSDGEKIAKSVGYKIDPVMEMGGLCPRAMSRRTPVEPTDRIRADVCRGIELGVPISEIFRQLNLPKRYYHSWLTYGRRQPRGLYRKFFTEVRESRRVATMDTADALESALLSSALDVSVKLNVKTTRLVSLTREQEIIIDEHFLDSPELAEKFKDGIIVKQEVQSIEVLPDPKVARELLEKYAPEEWGKSDD